MGSLKRKFKELHNKRIPTGDPLCLPAVCRVEHLRKEMIDRLDASNLNLEEGEDNLEEGGNFEGGILLKAKMRK